jgi:hypothetical protein
MACSKMSVLHLMRRLSTQGMRHAYPYAFAGIVTWTVFSVFALAFQCGATNPWLYSPANCAGQGAVWYPVIILNIFTDAVLSFLFAPIALRLQMGLVQRLTVTGTFGLRILYVSQPYNKLPLTREKRLRSCGCANFPTSPCPSCSRPDQ